MEESNSLAAGILQEDNGNSSSMRVMSFISLLAALAVAAIMLFKPPTDATTGLYIFTAFLIGAFIPKALQKFAEQKVK